MAVAVLDLNNNVDDGVSYTAAAGADRALVWPIGARIAGSLIDFQSAVFGAVAMNVRGEGRRTSGTTGRSVAVVDVLEAAIPGGSNAFVGTWDVAPDGTEGGALTLSGVHQTVPVGTAVNAQSSTGTSAVLPSMTVVDDGLSLVGCVANNAAITASAGYTTILSVVVGSFNVLWQYKLITADGAEVPSCALSVDTAWAIVGVPYKPSAAAGGARHGGIQLGDMNSFLRC